MPPNKGNIREIKTKEARMRFAFASGDKMGRKGEVSMHSGRCPYYTFLEVEDGLVKSWKVLDNPY